MREALEALEHGSIDGVMGDAQLMALLETLATDSLRLSEMLQGRLLPRRQSAPEPQTAPRGKPKVLVVDDDAASLESMTRSLAGVFEVTPSNRAAEAAQLAREHMPDAVVTDLCMPDVDGLGLLDLLKGNRLAPPPPLLVLSPYTDDGPRRNHALERGAFDYLTQPIDISELIARLHRAVQHGQELKREHALQLTDDLTGVYNRRALQLSLNDALAQSLARGQPVALVLVDQDGLKRINDCYGHAAGDKCIIAIARALQNAGRSTDMVVRYGGDEFAVVMPNTTIEGAQKMLERACSELSKNPVTLEKSLEVPVQISYGIAAGLAAAFDSTALLAAADAALYAMKRQNAPGRS
jgi:diguanylate cyclase (GGDEF)-like protein